MVLFLARGEPVTAIAASYDLTEGALWPIVVATVLVSPLIGGLLSRGRHGKGEPPAARRNEPSSGDNGS
jgi:hypothetical protein